jgi:cytochrome c oxidase subunit IV
MEHHSDNSEITYHHEPRVGTKHIWRIFWLLLGITIVELILGYMVHAVDFAGWLELFIKGVIVILSLAKAFYIVSYFMHLGDEIRNLIMTIVLPLFLFVWFIAAFLWDGSAYRAKRNQYDAHFRESTMEREMRSADTTLHPLD